MLTDKDSGTHLNFPGSMLIHTDEEAPEFHYFVSTLRGPNREIENMLFVRCDRQKAIVKDLSRVLPIAQFLLAQNMCKITSNAR